MSSDEEMLVFAGSGSPRLTAKICQSLAIEIRAGEGVQFSDG
ncbi:MAG TPA: ribose-phosphate pyrophosphokinase, partial [Candidatus Handelsmanbacteria bacterium]|nr:ribose-phosphate pyrophosphokinase [Candidatus Handelsmanbacteria bacterium]